MVKTSAKTQKSRLSVIRNHKILFIIGLLALLILVLLIKNGVEARKDKEKFEQARTSLDKVYADITSTVGAPDNYKGNNHCNESFFGAYNLVTNCSVGIQLAYATASLDEANTKFITIQSLIDTNKFKPLGSLTSGMSDFKDGAQSYKKALGTYKFSDLNCGASYIFDSPEKSALNLSDGTKNKKELFIDISCYGLAKKGYYSLQN
jgi:hypothetical protein